MPYLDPERTRACDAIYRRSEARRQSWRRWWARVNPRRRSRLALHRRDGWRCHYCRKRGTMRTLTRDHIIPRKDGGPNTLDNLVSACRSCNQRKGTKSYSSFIERIRAERGEVPLWVEEDEPMILTGAYI